MNRSTVVLAVSLAANVALGVLVLTKSPLPAVPRTEQPTRTAAAPAVTGTGHQSPAAAAESPVAIAATGRASWSTLRTSDDLAVLVTRLREAGFPRPVLRQIIQSLVAERFDARRYEIDTVALHNPYWKKWPNAWADPKLGPQMRNLSREQDKLLEQLLGETRTQIYADSEDHLATLQQRFGNLPLEKMERLNAYLSGHYEKQAQLYAAAQQGRAMLPSDYEKLVALDQEMRQGLANLLTPEEANEFVLREGAAAGRLKFALGPIRPAEQEYRTIHQLYQAYLDQFPAAYGGQTSGGTVPPAQKAAEEAMFAQLASALGPDRAAELKIAMDPKYSYLSRVVSRLELPVTTAPKIMDVQQEIQRRAAEIRHNAALAATDRTNQLTALAQEASARLTTVLGGQRGLDVYRQNGGQWLDSLVPPKG